jgi:hypothetical protein
MDDLVDQVVEEVRTELERELATATDTEAIEAELSRLRLEEKRLASAIARLPDSEALLDELQERLTRIRRLEAAIAASRRNPARQRDLLGRVEGMARQKLANLRVALAGDPQGKRDLFADLFPPGALRLSPVVMPRPGRRPRAIWRIEGSARFTFLCDPTGSLLNVEAEIPVFLVARAV